MRPGIERAAAGARANGTPFISFFTPEQMLALARDAGFRDARHLSAATLAERYFANRTDGLRPPNDAGADSRDDVRGSTARSTRRRVDRRQALSMDSIE